MKRFGNNARYLIILLVLSSVVGFSLGQKLHPKESNTLRLDHKGVLGKKVAENDEPAPLQLRTVMIPTSIPSPTPTPTPTPAPTPNPSACSRELWKHVIGWGTRIQLIDECRIIRGKVTSTASISDGDMHIEVDVDQPYRWQVAGGSKINTEIICEHTPSSAAYKKVCSGYRNTIQVPKKGDYIEIIGPHVIDSHGNREIHPIDSLRKL